MYKRLSLALIALVLCVLLAGSVFAAGYPVVSEFVVSDPFAGKSIAQTSGLNYIDDIFSQAAQRTGLSLTEVGQRYNWSRLADGRFQFQLKNTVLGGLELPPVQGPNAATTSFNAAVNTAGKQSATALARRSPLTPTSSAHVFRSSELTATEVNQLLAQGARTRQSGLEVYLELPPKKLPTVSNSSRLSRILTQYTDELDDIAAGLKRNLVVPKQGVSTPVPVISSDGLTLYRYDPTISRAPIIDAEIVRTWSGVSDPASSRRVLTAAKPNLSGRANSQTVGSLTDALKSRAPTRAALKLKPTSTIPSGSPNGLQDAVRSQVNAIDDALKAKKTPTRVPLPRRPVVSSQVVKNINTVNVSGNNSGQIFNGCPMNNCTVNPQAAASAEARIATTAAKAPKPTTTPKPTILGGAIPETGEEIWVPGKSPRAATSLDDAVNAANDKRPWMRDVYGADVDPVSGEKVVRKSRFSTYFKTALTRQKFNWKYLSGGTKGVKGVMKGTGAFVGKVFGTVIKAQVVADLFNYAILKEAGAFGGQYPHILPKIEFLDKDNSKELTQIIDYSDFGAVTNHNSLVSFYTEENENQIYDSSVIFDKGTWPEKAFFIRTNSSDNIYYSREVVAELNKTNLNKGILGNLLSNPRLLLNALSLGVGDVTSNILFDDQPIVEDVYFFIADKEFNVVYDASCESDSSNGLNAPNFNCDLTGVEERLDLDNETYIVTMFVKFNPLVSSASVDELQDKLVANGCNFNPVKMRTLEGNRVNYCGYISKLFNEEGRFEETINKELVSLKAQADDGFFQAWGENFKNGFTLTEIAAENAADSKKSVLSRVSYGALVLPAGILEGVGWVFSGIGAYFTSDRMKNVYFKNIDSLEDNKIGTATMLVGYPIITEIGQASRISESALVSKDYLDLEFDLESGRALRQAFSKLLFKEKDGANSNAKFYFVGNNKLKIVVEKGILEEDKTYELYFTVKDTAGKSIDKVATISGIKRNSSATPTTAVLTGTAPCATARAPEAEWEPSGEPMTDADASEDNVAKAVPLNLTRPRVDGYVKNMLPKLSALYPNEALLGPLSKLDNGEYLDYKVTMHDWIEYENEYHRAVYFRRPENNFVNEAAEFSYGIEFHALDDPWNADVWRITYSNKGGTYKEFIFDVEELEKGEALNRDPNKPVTFGFEYVFYDGDSSISRDLKQTILALEQKQDGTCIQTNLPNVAVLVDDLIENQTNVNVTATTSNGVENINFALSNIYNSATGQVNDVPNELFVVGTTNSALNANESNFVIHLEGATNESGELAVAETVRVMTNGVPATLGDMPIVVTNGSPTQTILKVKSSEGITNEVFNLSVTGGVDEAQLILTNGNGDVQVDLSELVPVEEAMSTASMAVVSGDFVTSSVPVTITNASGEKLEGTTKLSINAQIKANGKVIALLGDPKRDQQLRLTQTAQSSIFFKRTKELVFDESLGLSINDSTLKKVSFFAFEPEIEHYFIELFSIDDAGLAANGILGIITVDPRSDMKEKAIIQRIDGGLYITPFKGEGYERNKAFGNAGVPKITPLNAEAHESNTVFPILDIELFANGNTWEDGDKLKFSFYSWGGKVNPSNVVEFTFNKSNGIFEFAYPNKIIINDAELNKPIAVKLPTSDSSRVFKEFIIKFSPIGSEPSVEILQALPDAK